MGKNDQTYVSTLAFGNRSVEQIIEIALKNELNVEFTSNLEYTPNLIQSYLDAPLKRMAHNYFPTPKVPFVLNLASGNELIRQRSIDHCLNGLKICKQSQAPFFAAHAGFCIDPNPDDLGKAFSARDFEREDHKNLFLSSLEIIVARARELAIPFLIENNVLIRANLINSQNPLLCCESSEVEWVFKKIDSDFFGLLMDTAHLKVSCETLGLDANGEFENLVRYVRAVHHSDNNGMIDNNQPLTMDYWFLKHMPKVRDLVHVIEVKNIEVEIIFEQIGLLEQYGR